MIELLGARAITVLRYPAPAYAGEGWYVPGTPTTTEIIGTVDTSPRTRERQTPGGKTATVDAEVVSYSEIRAASDTQQQTADRLVIDGRTYEVAIVDRSPPFEGGQPESWKAYCTEVQPLVSELATPVAPTNLQPPAINIDGTTLRAWPGLWSGTPPIAFAYSWEVDGVPVSDGTSITQPDEGTVVLVVTATNGVDPAGVAESPPLGGGTGPVDCVVTCADAIQAAVDAAVAPLEAEIAQLEEDIAEVQALYDAALITIAERDAEILTLEATITALNAAIERARGYRNYGLIAPVASAGVTLDPLTGVVSWTVTGGAGVDPGDATTYVTWRLQDVDGAPTEGWPWGPYLLRRLSGADPASGIDITIVLHSQEAIDAAGAYGIAFGVVLSPSNTAPLLQARVAGGGWSRSAGTPRPGLAGMRATSADINGASGGSLAPRVTCVDAAGLSINTGGSSQTGTIVWGSGTAPPLRYLSLAITGPSSGSGTLTVEAPPCTQGLV